MAKHKLTKKFIDSLPYQPKQVFYWDRQLPGFGVCVGKTSKSYVAQKDVNGRAVRCTIGKHGVWHPETARKEARELLLQMSKGLNPNEIKRQKRKRGITLAETYKRYRKDSEKRLAEGTLINYEDFIENHFADWQPKELAAISPDMIVKRHKAISDNSGRYAANASMQFLRALYNYAKIDIEDLANPVTVLSRKKLWNPTTRRKTFINDHQLADWYSAVMNLQNETIRDALRLLLFTGLRKMEAFTLRWENVDLKGKTLLIPDTKNKSPLTLPLSKQLLELLERRKQNAGTSPWVFPGGGKAGHITDAKKAVKQITQESEVDFTLHDLRRTFSTIAEKIGIPTSALKKLLNHKTRDVTTGYIVFTAERLQEPLQKINDEMVRLIDKES